jgi:hypothetical protein
VKPRVYIETSIPSFYYEVRIEPDMVARREWTREFWTAAESDYELVTSPAVIEELEDGKFPGQQDAIDLVSRLPSLLLEPEIADIVVAYIAHKLMPADPSGDALHLAIASYHKCDFLLTWNCTHLANANKFGHIRRINVMLGLSVPMLVTPLELLGVPP